MGGQAKNDESRWREMMAAAQTGDQDAYQTLLAELGSAIDAYLRSRFGQPAWIEDCVQESLVAIHRARHTYDPARPFRPWLFALVRHKAIDVFRSRSYALNREFPDETVGSDEEATERTESAAHAIDAARLLDRLPADYRDALRLTKIEGFSVQEAAERLGVSSSAIKSRVSRGIQKIRRELQTEDE